MTVPNPKVLMVAGEALPYAATGGLADVAGSLPQALNGLGADVRVVMPLYGGIREQLRKTLVLQKAVTVALSWRNQYCGIFMGCHRGVTYYLIDNEYYFKRDTLYGCPDDGERFAFLSKAALEILPHVGFKPDIIHANDWHTGMVPVYYRAFFNHLPHHLGAKLVTTIHNIQYQGQMDPYAIGDLLGLGQEWKPLLEYDGSVNLLKAAVEASDAFTTVSPTYCREITTPEYGHGLHGYLAANAHKGRGIVNGIDTDNYDPSSTTDMHSPYSAKDPSGKAVNKAALQAELGLGTDPGAPIIAMVTRLTESKGLDLVRESFDAIMEGLPGGEPPQFVLLGSGDPEYHAFFAHMQSKYPGRVAAVLDFKPALAKWIYAGSDLFLMPSRTEACGLSQMIALRYGTLPVVRATGGLSDTVSEYDTGTHRGNGFVFGPYDSGEMLGAIRRALGLYARGDAWQGLVARAMECDFGWKRSARDYMTLYGELASGR